MRFCGGYTTRNNDAAAHSASRDRRTSTQARDAANAHHDTDVMAPRTADAGSRVQRPAPRPGQVWQCNAFGRSHVPSSWQQDCKIAHNSAAVQGTDEDNTVSILHFCMLGAMQLPVCIIQQDQDARPDGVAFHEKLRTLGE